MNLNQNTLVQFEAERFLNDFVPPEKSNSFYNIGGGKLNFFCFRSNPIDYRFDLYTESGAISTGAGIFHIGGIIKTDSGEYESPYEYMVVKENTSLCVNDTIIINKGTVEVHGTLSMIKGSKLIVNNGGTLILYSDSTFRVEDGTTIEVEVNKGASISIYGDINVKLEMVDSIINNDGVYVDSAAHVNVEDIDLGKREYSLTDYEMALRDKTINPHTQGEYNSSTGRIGYTWKDGDPLKNARSIELGVLWGTAVLGDFKLSILGKQLEKIEDLLVLESFRVAEGTTLYISNEYNGWQYLRSELYLGIVIGNCQRPGHAIVDGSIVVDGETAKIAIDRGASLTIGKPGIIYLNDGSIIQSTHNDPDSIVLTINGTLIIDDISQLVGFESGNIAFGEDGKLIILNPDTGERRLLWSTPNGIENTDLYRIFKDKIKHIQYHISNNTGIKIDQYFDFYARDMTNWYGGVRIEKAIYDGMLVWHDGGFIELDHDIIPWADTTCSLFQAARLFKSFSSDNKERLQEVTERLKYAGAGNIVFRFVEGDKYSDINMDLEGITMTGVVNKPLTDAYILTTDNNGNLFTRNLASSPDKSSIINGDSKMITLTKGRTEFQL